MSSIGVGVVFSPLSWKIIVEHRSGIRDEQPKKGARTYHDKHVVESANKLPGTVLRKETTGRQVNSLSGSGSLVSNDKVLP